MKRLSCLILVFSLLLSGCSVLGERIKEPVTFYYVNTDYQKEMSQVIGSEVREASGHGDDLPYLLALYSMGPSKENLRTLLPRNTGIILSERTEHSIELTLSESATAMTDADYTLASACIAMTCMELTNVQQVSVVCGERSVTMRRDNLLLDSRLIVDTQEETK